MKKIAIALAVLALFLGIMAYNIWRAENETIIKTPGVVQQERVALHTQLTQAAQREAEIEKLYWNSPIQLQTLIKSHQQRIEQLTGNTAGGEIVAHDKDAIARLQKRIADLEAQKQEQAAEQTEQVQTDSQPK